MAESEVDRGVGPVAASGAGGGDGGDRRRGDEEKRKVVEKDKAGGSGASADVGKGKEVKSSKGKVPASNRKLYGKPGNLWCVICRANRDHLAADCPGNFCNRCKERGHWARQCMKTICEWCGKAGHIMKECPVGGAEYLQGGMKRKSEVEGQQPKAKVAAVGSGMRGAMSYPLVASKPKHFLSRVVDSLMS